MDLFIIDFNVLKNVCAHLLDSKRSDSCIDFTMMCVFYNYFFCVCHHVLEQ